MSRSANKSAFERIVNTPRITFILTLIAACASLGINLAYTAFNGFNPTTWSLFFLTATCLLLFWVQHRGHYRAAGVLLYLLVTGVLTFNIIKGNAIHDVAMIAFPTLIVFTSLMFGKRYITLVTLVAVLQLVIVYILSLFGIVQPFEGRYALHLEETITTIIMLLVTGALLWVVVNLIERTAQKIIHSEFEAERAYDLTLEAWAQALELRQREVKGHSQRVTALTVALAERLGYDREALAQLRRGALLHDIGKMGITEKILHKPGPLSAEEWEAITRHTCMGEEILRDIPALQEAKKVVCCHHERIDGQGYPLKMTGEEIPEGSRIFAVADSWDMLRSERPYSPAWTDEQTLAHLQKEAGRQFDARVVAALLDLLAGQNRERQER